MTAYAAAGAGRGPAMGTAISQERGQRPPAAGVGASPKGHLPLVPERRSGSGAGRRAVPEPVYLGVLVARLLQDRQLGDSAAGA